MQQKFEKDSDDIYEDEKAYRESNADELIKQRSKLHLISRDPADDAYDEANDYHAEAVMNDDLIQAHDPADDIAEDSKEYQAEPNTADDLVQTKAVRESDDIYEDDKQY